MHSIGAGSFIAEIQQTSDITYRIYDFNRKEPPTAKPASCTPSWRRRPSDYTVLDDYRTRYAPEPNRAVELVSPLLHPPSSTSWTGPAHATSRRSTRSLAVICTDGEARLTADGGEPLSVHAGETVLVPAAVRSLRMEPAPAARLLTSCIR